MTSKYVKLLALSWAAALAACGGSSGHGSGRLSIALTDAPADGADAVFVAFTGIEVKPAAGPAFMLEEFVPPKSVDLLELRDGLNQAIASAEVPAGQYDWMRLAVNLDDNGVIDQVTESHVLVNGVPYPLRIPVAAQTGLKLASGFIVPRGGQTHLWIDFGLVDSVGKAEDENAYVLRPALRLADDVVVDSLAGNIDPNLFVGGPHRTRPAAPTQSR